MPQVGRYVQPSCCLGVELVQRGYTDKSGMEVLPAGGRLKQEQVQREGVCQIMGVPWRPVPFL
jgi:hypothetical protein